MKNVGKKDARIRYVISAVLILVGLVLWQQSLPFATAAIVSGVVLTITGMVGFCGLYKVFGIDTCPLGTKQK